MRPSCRRRSADTIAPFVDTLDDALFVIANSTTTDRFGLLVLMLTTDRRLLAVVEMRDVDDTRVNAACEWLLGTIEREGGRRAAVIATARYGRGVDATAVDHGRFREVRATFEAAGVELIDWLWVDRDLVRSLGAESNDLWDGGGS